MFCKIGVLTNFAKFRKKTSVPESLYNKVPGAAYNFTKKETLTQVFPVNFAKFLRNLFKQNTSGGMLLHIMTISQN